MSEHAPARVRRSGRARPRRGGAGCWPRSLRAAAAAAANSYSYDVAIRVALNAIVCIGLNLLIGYAGQISLGHAGFFALGAYGSAILTARYGWPPLLALAAGALRGRRCWRFVVGAADPAA